MSAAEHISDCDEHTGHIWKSDGNRICRVGEDNTGVRDTNKVQALTGRTGERAGAGNRSCYYAVLDSAILRRQVHVTRDGG